MACRWVRRCVASPLGVGVTAAVGAFGFVVLRLAVAARGDVSRFAVAGDSFVDPRTVSPRIHVFAGSGYDGQFSWRLAIDPGARQLAAVHGARIDQPLRLGRVAYPTLAWLLAAGHPPFVSWALVLVNVISVGVIAGGAAAICRNGALPPIYGLLVALQSGVVMSLSRDLNEVVMVAGVTAGILFVLSRSPLFATAAFTVAVLAHEQALYVVGALAVTRLVHFVGDKTRPTLDDVAWVVPSLAFGTWQLISRAIGTQLPVAGSGNKSVGLPVAGFVHAVTHWLRIGFPTRQDYLVVPELIVVAMVVVVAARAVRKLASGDRWLAGALAVAVVLTVCLSYNVWKGPADLRQIVLVPVLAWLVILAARVRPSALLVCSTVVVGLATLGLRVLAI